MTAISEHTDKKRLFFGVEVHGLWPSALPKGRYLDEAHRHLTLAFLGDIPYEAFHKIADQIPPPPMRVGSVGYFNECLVLPPRHPHVVAWQTHWWDGNPQLHDYQSSLSKWLSSHHYEMDERPWKPHVTICRSPFNPKEWLKAFKPLPFYSSSIHLYESKGNLSYVPIKSFSILPPFEEIEHTADMAFLVRGENVREIYHHAFGALTFKVPELMDFYASGYPVDSLDDVIMLLNSSICKADAAVGCPLKAVSFHGQISVLPDSLLQWEMIVDV